MGGCEPCQAGNRAALNSLSRARSKSAHSYDRVRRIFLFCEVKPLMAYQALYRKYRPETFSEVVGQEHITKTLKNGIDEGKTVHAYLFTGTRGTGKTTCAKILAKALNCLSPKDGNPCGECEMCRAIKAGTVTDIVEIDAASNNRVDDVRELREQVNFPPASAKYRVYIIDEVHMLSIGAFNALLKTLEEPPEHVVFILATTEVHKLPATILSRCQRFDFRRIESSVIAEHLDSVAKREGFSITPDAAMLIAGAADGGMRDALSLLDLCAAADRNITEETVAEVCSMAGNDYLLQFADHIKKRDTEKALMLIDELHNSSVDIGRLLTELIRHFRDLMIIKTVKSGNLPIVCSKKRLEDLKEQSLEFDIKEIVAILDILRNAASGIQSGSARTAAEMAVIRLCNPEIRNDISSLELRISALESGAVSKTKPMPSESAAETPQIKTEPVSHSEEPLTEDIPSPAAEEPAVSETAEVSDDASEPALLDEWPDIIAVLQNTCPIIAGVLGDSKAYISGGRLLIDTNNSQFRSLCNGASPVYRESIRKAAEKILGKTYKLGPYKKQASEKSDDPFLGFAQKLKELEK